MICIALKKLRACFKVMHLWFFYQADNVKS